MFHRTTITIKSTRFEAQVSTIANKTKYTIHTTIAVLKSLVNLKMQKKFQRAVKKDKNFKEYANSITTDFENLPIYGCLVNESYFVIVDGQHRVYHIFKSPNYDNQEIELVIFKVANWVEAADKFYKINNCRPQSSAIILHNSLNTGKYLRECAKIMIEAGYITDLNIEGRSVDEKEYNIDCQDIALLLKASMNGTGGGALHGWIRSHKHEMNADYVSKFIKWMNRMNSKIRSKINDSSTFERNFQVALASTYHKPEVRELAEENISEYMNDKNFAEYKVFMKSKSRGDDRKPAWLSFILDSVESAKSIKLEKTFPVVAIA